MSPVRSAPRRRAPIRPTVTRLEGRDLLAHASPAAHGAAAAIRSPAPAPVAVSPINFAGDIQGNANFYPADYHRPDENRAVVTAHGRLKPAGHRPGQAFTIERQYYPSDVETRPFFNGPSQTDFDFTIRLRNGKHVAVDGVLLAEPIDGHDLHFFYSGTIRSAHGGAPAGELSADCVYTISQPVQPPSFITLQSGPFRGQITGSVDLARI